MKSILIIDDSPLYRALLSQCFEIAGWRVFQADSGNSGLDTACDVLPGYIICDMIMPNGDGMDVVQGVRADPRLKNTKIIMFTGRDDTVDREAALQAGANAYVVKPVETTAIFSLVEQLGHLEPEPPHARVSSSDTVHLKPASRV